MIKVLTNDEMATLANLTLKAELCNYEGVEWLQILCDLNKLVNGREYIAEEILRILGSQDYTANVFTRAMTNLYLELLNWGSQFAEV